MRTMGRTSGNRPPRPAAGDRGARWPLPPSQRLLALWGRRGGGGGKGLANPPLLAFGPSQSAGRGGWGVSPPFGGGNSCPAPVPRAFPAALPGGGEGGGAAGKGGGHPPPNLCRLSPPGPASSARCPRGPALSYLRERTSSCWVREASRSLPLPAARRIAPWPSRGRLELLVFSARRERGGGGGGVDGGKALA